MAVRVKPKDVEALLGRNYDSRIDLTRPIRTANAIVARMITCATQQSYTHTSQELEQIEGWLACYYYCAIDPLYTSKSTGGASGSYYRPGDKSPFLQSALDLDGSGCLAAITSGSRARLSFLGKPASEQRSYDDMNG